MSCARTLLVLLFAAALIIGVWWVAIWVIHGGRYRKLRVWFVDDREQNRRDFEHNHAPHFEVRTFDQPAALLEALRHCGHPDIMLCDIYFYDDVVRREEAEQEVAKLAEELRKTPVAREAEEAQRGIVLIEQIHSMFGYDPPFTVYAYTSKGPYLLASSGFERINSAGARLLLKNKFSPDAERRILSRDFGEFHARSGAARLWSKVAAVGVLGAALGVIFDRIASRCLGF